MMPAASATRSPAEDMVLLPGGSFRMGSDRHYPEERPAHLAEVGAFWIDRAPVTNAAFTAFVAATGYCTVAEHAPDPADFPGADPATLVPGSIVFRPPARPEDMRAWGDWWAFVAGACWHRPDGGVARAEPTHPAVHIAHEDAQAYAAWAGKALPTEMEWEFAAKGGRDGAEYAWGDTLTQGGTHHANTWQGLFPFDNLLEDGFAGTSPVGCYPANPFGLLDMIGNVWEWTADIWAPRHHANTAAPCCSGGATRRANTLQFVIKGGSHLCAPNYCQRYRPAARQPQAADSGTSHIGFRCVRRDGAGSPPGTLR